MLGVLDLTVKFNKSDGAISAEATELHKLALVIWLCVIHLSLKSLFIL